MFYCPVPNKQLKSYSIDKMIVKWVITTQSIWMKNNPDIFQGASVEQTLRVWRRWGAERWQNRLLPKRRWNGVRVQGEVQNNGELNSWVCCVFTLASIILPNSINFHTNMACIKQRFKTTFCLSFKRRITRNFWCPLDSFISFFLQKRNAKYT